MGVLPTSPEEIYVCMYVYIYTFYKVLRIKYEATFAGVLRITVVYVNLLWLFS